jgi:hypothetical protein
MTEQARILAKFRGPETVGVHCWEAGPETDDGMSTTCMLWDRHEGEHQWTRDDGIMVTFSPAKEA